MATIFNIYQFRNRNRVIPGSRCDKLAELDSVFNNLLELSQYVSYKQHKS